MIINRWHLLCKFSPHSLQKHHCSAFNYKSFSQTPSFNIKKSAHILLFCLRFYCHTGKCSCLDNFCGKGPGIRLPPGLGRLPAPTAFLSSTCDIFFTERKEGTSSSVHSFISLRQGAGLTYAVKPCMMVSLNNPSLFLFSCLLKLQHGKSGFSEGSSFSPLTFRPLNKSREHGRQAMSLESPRDLTMLMDQEKRWPKCMVGCM